MEIHTGDVLFSLVRPYLKNIAIVPPSLDGQVASTAYCVLRPCQGIESRFLFYQVIQETFIHSVPTYGNSPPSARDEEFLDIEVRLAPEAEQRRIVDKIDELFSDLDAAVAALERVQAKLKRYRATVLKAAVEGKLTEEWRKQHRDTERAAVLLARILEERRRRWEEARHDKFKTAKESPKNWREKYPVPMPPDRTDLPCIPTTWEVASLDQLSQTITSGSRDWSQYYDRGSGTFIMAQNVRPGRLDLSSRQLVDPPPGDRDKARSQVQNGDLLITIVGANTGDVCRVRGEFPEHYVCQSVALVRPVDTRCSAFLEQYFVSDENGQRQFRRYIYGQGRPHLGFDELRVTAVVLPPLAEQAEIVREVEARLSVVDQLAAQVEANLRRASLLRQGILKRAFEGELVSQDPTDEPADKLLERIRAVRNGQPSAKTQRRRRGEGAAE